MNRARINVDVLAIVLMGFLAFGLQIPTLGFFQDDWNFVFYSSARGAEGLEELVRLDGRPGAAWLYILGFAVLGYKPAFWHFFALLLRVLTTLNVWLILNRLWPSRRYGNLLVCIFFLAYPFFVLQPLAVTFTQHFAGYFLFTLSIWLTIKALETPERYLQFTIPAVLLTFLHLFTIEYFVGLELLRSLIIWFHFAGRQKRPWREDLRKTFLHWLPYLLALAFFVIWRTLFSMDTGVRNAPSEILSDSGETIVLVARNILADLVLMLVNPWLKLADPALFVIGPSRNFYIWGTILLGAAAYYFVTRHANQDETRASELKTVFLAGALIVAAGMISTYAIGYIVNLKLPPWNSRFSISSLLGLSMLAAAIIETVITSRQVRHIFLAVLVGLVIGWHNQNTLNFRLSWEKQTRLYQQWMWRAPSIAPNTAIIANEEILGYMGDYPTSFALNTMYESPRSNLIPYWFFAISENFQFNTERISDTSLDVRRGAAFFDGTEDQVLFITYEPENRQCLWVLRPEDGEHRWLPDNLKKAALNSSTQTIQPASAEKHLYKTILQEDTNTWCYFYQNADLARQFKDWETVAALWEEASSKGLEPGSGFEYIPFIEAYAHLGDWQESFRLTKTANYVTEAMYFVLCPAWSRLDEATPASEQKEVFVAKARDLMKCGPE